VKEQGEYESPVKRSIEQEFGLGAYVRKLQRIKERTES
jgi:hypothetical protein